MKVFTLQLGLWLFCVVKPLQLFNCIGLVAGEIGSSLLPGLDDTEQTKFLDEHDLNEVLNKLPEEAFDIFTGITGGKDLNKLPGGGV